MPHAPSLLPPPTILAVATAAGHSPRGIVRISGPGIGALLERHLDRRLDGQRRCETARLAVGGLDLPVFVAFFPGPRTYTGEDSAELQLPGHPRLLRRVLDGLVDSAAGRGVTAREAEPGEYTARAFLSGRLSLTAAEGVAATIAARSDAELRAAAILRRGRLAETARGLADDLADALALVEAGIDFSDQEDVVPIETGELARRLATLRDRIDALLERSVGMERLEAIPWVVLTGRANAGKSSLFNALLGHERAVISAAAGTTRDALVEPLRLAHGETEAEIMLVDVAGDEAPASELDRRMQAAAADALDRTELRVHCVPVTKAGDEVDDDVLLVRTKGDLASEPPDRGLVVSARTGEGLDRLRRALAERLDRPAVSLADDTTVLQARHEQALRSARQHLAESIARTDVDDPAIVAATMRLALDALAALAGDMTPDDVLGRVFGRFCVGK